MIIGTTVLTDGRIHVLHAFFQTNVGSGVLSLIGSLLAITYRRDLHASTYMMIYLNIFYIHVFNFPLFGEVLT